MSQTYRSATNPKPKHHFPSRERERACWDVKVRGVNHTSRAWEWRLYLRSSLTYLSRSTERVSRPSRTHLFSQRHSRRIVAARAKRVTAADPADAAPESAHYPIFPQCPNHVIATRGLVAADRPQKGADESLVAADQ